jgi:tetratricopeptide (TPR) repeat protein
MAMIVVGVIGLLGIVAFIIFGLPLLRSIVEKSPSLYEPADDSSRIMPEYSIAEARVNEGKYREAVDEYRKVIAKHPDDIYPHLRIAEVVLDHLNDNNLVEAELLSALGKAKGEVSIALAVGRLADFYQLTLNDPARALEVMKQVREKIPGTKRAKLAEERIAVLEGIIHGGASLPKTPDKIASRPSRYKMSE